MLTVRRTLLSIAVITQTAILCCGSPAQADGKRPMTFADLQAIKRISDPQISPGGHWVLFSVTDVDLEKNTKTNHLSVVPLPSPTPASTTPSASAAGADRQLTTGAGEASGRFSPDGHEVAFIAGDQLQLAAWDERTGTLGKAHALTAVATGADGPVWSPDSTRLLFVSSVYPVCSNLDTWHAEDLCDKEKDDAAAKNPVKAQLWDHLLYRHWNQYTGEKRSHILVVNAASSADEIRLGKGIRDLTPRSVVGDAETPTFSLGGPIGYAWSPDSHEIAYVTNLDATPAASTNNDVFTLRLDEENAKAVKISTSPGSDDAPAYSPDGKYLAFRSQARAGYEADRVRLMLYDRGAKTTRELLPHFDREIDEFVWQTPTIIYLISGNKGEANVFSLDVNGQLQGWHGDPLLVQETAQGEYSGLTLSRDDNTLVTSKMTVQHPAELVALDTKYVGHTAYSSPSNYDGIPGLRSGPLPESILSSLNDTLFSQLDLSRLESFTFPGANSTPVQGFLIRPPNFDPSRKYPLKFLIHGGPQGAWGDAWSYRWNPELFAADGYVVVMINPRGSTGYGQTFVDGVNGDWGGKPYVDLMRGLDFAERKYPFIDKSRECALGASYGGFMADWILTHTSRFACIVTHDGMANPESAYGTTDELWFNEWEFRRQTPSGPAKEPGQPWRYAAGPAEQDPFRKWSPIRYISNARTPTLVIHSQRDYRLDVSEGLQLFTALQRRGVPSEMLYFPDEGHWVLKPQNSELWYKTVNDWCDRWTHSNAFASSAEPAPGVASSPAPRSTRTSSGSQPKSQQPDR